MSHMIEEINEKHFRCKYVYMLTSRIKPCVRDYSRYMRKVIIKFYSISKRYKNNCEKENRAGCCEKRPPYLRNVFFFELIDE